MTSWFLRLAAALGARRWLSARPPPASRRAASTPRSSDAADERRARRLARSAAVVASLLLFLVLVALLVRGLAARSICSGSVPLARWLPILAAARLRRSAACLLSTALGTLWALPAGLAIGLSPRLSRLLQPVVQVVASFPAPMLFPLVDRRPAAPRASRSGWAASC